MTFPYDISVIVPIFNSETFIEPCMECLLGQTVGFPRMEVLPDMDFFHNRHPAEFPLFPVMFITIACGAVSGFHATQSPLMARCLKTEKEGLPVFGGAMITEGIIAFIWAAAALTFYGSPEALA